MVGRIHERLVDGGKQFPGLSKILNLLWDRRPVHLPTQDLSSGSPTEVIFEIPNWARRIEIILHDVSLDGGSDRVTARVGTGTSLLTTGYDGTRSRVTGSASATTDAQGFTIESNSASALYSGGFVFTKISDDLNIWACRGVVARSDSAAMHIAGGAIDLGSSPLAIAGLGVRGAGGDAYDGGTVGCRYSR